MKNHEDALKRIEGINLSNYENVIDEITEKYNLDEFRTGTLVQLINTKGDEAIPEVKEELECLVTYMETRKEISAHSGKKHVLEKMATMPKIPQNCRDKHQKWVLDTETRANEILSKAGYKNN